MKNFENIKILDCTLRDGGYYTNWDFESDLVNNYFDAMEKISIDYVEIGYRSPELNGYLGEYFYCPEYVMKHAREKMPSKKLAIILDTKNIKVDGLETFLEPCKPYISLIRMAVSPDKFLEAIEIAKKIKELGFEVAFNVMYMSDWLQNEGFLSQLSLVDGLIDVFYMVDSYGGVTPSEVKQIAEIVKSKISTPLAFHGHNNLELGLINTLTAIECGCEIVDATITGMGRGAGNLKTELLLTYLASKHQREVGFNYLASTVEDFQDLNKSHNWGTNLPYMVSGSNSLPQKQVMDWIAKSTYSIDSIITAIQNTNSKQDTTYPIYNPSRKNKKCLIVGGGNSVEKHKKAILEFLRHNQDICIIHVSSRNAFIFSDLEAEQYFCMMGNEGHRMKKVLNNKLSKLNLKCILPPSPRVMGTFIPEEVERQTYELESLSIDSINSIPLAMAFELALKQDLIEAYVVGFDGYWKDVTRNQLELAIENEYIFSKVKDSYIKVVSLTDTRYDSIEKQSIYSKIIK